MPAWAQPAVPLTPPAPVSAPATPVILSLDDVALYKEIMAAERDGKTTRAKSLIAKLRTEQVTEWHRVSREATV